MRGASGAAACRVWSDAEGRLLNPAHGSQSFQFQVERTMRLFYRLRYTHHRYLATADPTVDTLNTALQRSTSSQRLANGTAPTEPTVDGAVADASVFGGLGAHGMQFGEMETLRASVSDDRVKEEMEQLVEALSNGDSPAGLFLDLRCVHLQSQNPPKFPIPCTRARCPVRSDVSVGTPPRIRSCRTTHRQSTQHSFHSRLRLPLPPRRALMAG